MTPQTQRIASRVFIDTSISTDLAEISRMRITLSTYRSYFIMLADLTASTPSTVRSLFIMLADGTASTLSTVRSYFIMLANATAFTFLTSGCIFIMYTLEIFTIPANGIAVIQIPPIWNPIFDAGQGIKGTWRRMDNWQLPRS